MSKFTKVITAKTTLLLITLLTLTGCGTHFPSSTTDPSASFLHRLFNADPSQVLSGSWNSSAVHTTLDLAFRNLNTALLGGALLIFAYILIVGTIYSAQDGIFLGKKWGKTFVPIRAVLGLISVFPLGATGFCIAQWVIYSIAFLGIGIANAVWAPLASDIQPGKTMKSLPIVPANVQQQVNQDLAIMTFNSYMQKLIPCTQNTKNGCSVTVNGKPNSPITAQEYQMLSQAPEYQKAMKNEPKGVPSAYTQFIQPQLNSNITANNNAKSASSLPSPYPANFSNVKCANNVCNYFANSIEATVGYDVVYSKPTPAHPTSPIYIKASSLTQSIAKQINADTTATPYSISQNNSISSAFSNATTTMINMIQNCALGNSSACGDSNAMLSVNPFAFNPNSQSLYQANNNPQSWWNAGSQYLSLDEAFAKNIGKVMKYANDLNSIMSNGYNQVYHFNDTQQYWKVVQPSNKVIISLLPHAKPAAEKVIQSNVTENYPVIPKTISFTNTNPPVPNGGSAGALLSYATELAKANPTPAAQDLACRMGDSTACDNVNPTPSASNPNPTPYTYMTPTPLESGGSSVQTDIIDNLLAYFNYQVTMNGKTAPFANNAENNKTLQQLDNMLEFSLQTINGNASGNGTNTTGGGNPFINAGSKAVDGPNSDMHDTLGFLFQGLLGTQTGSTYIGGLLSEVWCIGLPTGTSNFPEANAMTAGKGPTQGKLVLNPNVYLVCPDQFTTKDPGLIAMHFSMIRSAQMVGVNLISGVVVGLMTTFSNYKTMMTHVLNTASSKGISTGDMVGAAALGPLGGGSWNGLNQKNIAEGEYATMVSISNLSMTLMWLPLMIFVFTLMFTTGVMFAITIPLMPYILFWAGKVAWILLVLEGLFAAPVAALAIQHPEGHDVWGMAENGFKIAINILIMPVMIICGLITAIVLTYGIISMSAYGFHEIAYSILQVVGAAGAQSSLTNLNPARSTTIIEGTMGVFIIFMYAYFLQMAFEKCFSAIYVIPERVMSWIGGQGIKFGEQEASKMSQKSDSTAAQGMQAGGQTVSQGTQAETQVGQSEAKQTFGDQKSSADADQAIGQEGWSNAQAMGSGAMGGGN